MSEAILRSYLFVPATRPDRVDKALASGADAVIVDLEDAVAPAEKSAAREAAARALSQTAPVFVRVNGPDTEWFEQDLELCAKVRARGVMIPKTESPAQVRHAVERLVAGTAIIPLIETAQGFAGVNALCAAPQVQRVALGTIDFQLDLGVTGERDELLYFRSGVVLASRLARIQPPLDGVTVEFNDPQVVREDTLYAKRLGFGGKLCIHPKQIGPVNDCYRPSADEIAWAQRIVDAAVAAKGAAVAVDGKMVDRPVILKAEEILRESKRAAS